MTLLDYDALHSVILRWVNSDEFETMNYCVQDLVPETRRDRVKLEAYHTAATTICRALEIEKGMAEMLVRSKLGEVPWE